MTDYTRPVGQSVTATGGSTIQNLDQHVEQHFYHGSRGRPTRPFQAPPLPSHFVARPEVSRDLLSRLLVDGPAAGSLTLGAVHGLGGVGKTTLAADLARSPEVRDRLPDGVLWVTLGQQPDLLPLVGGWVQALGDYEYKPINVEATAHTYSVCCTSGPPCWWWTMSGSLPTPGPFWPAAALPDADHYPPGRSGRRTRGRVGSARRPDP